ncbi:LON peptidase substrate-binding domain-containing protein [Chitinophaga nivalis]|uniref:LON peptidase substrate-binding domain-containing protein n=1 Tax=Chitinophaga nivalis TaxID=2991709 RepID=A0ABT3IVE0_9BACT|nr:LON peptidase substrate-binding domain-containing protein [Chitinophaga nivalis]MCW3462665.1 LON peptidase substrate-binding domain-containing protein [Chitinophaga nivalis]MCW3487644.1 LON peptidase substrate-binding domain-containing protein [Chitinophaga nivalis]
MTNFISIFPLSVVVYPGEQLNLHVFEPRYKQLIMECIAENKPFGIPAVVEKKLMEYGTLVQIEKVEKIYDNKEMDIVTRGLSVFRVLEYVGDIPDKLYGGAIVNYPENNESGNARLLKEVLHGVRELHAILQVHKTFKKEDTRLTAYDLAHHAGLSLEEEYELLHLFFESQRLEYLKRHLHKVIPMMAEMEKLKERVKLNGHFRNLSADDL